MSQIERLEWDLTAWFSDTAAPRTPDYVDDLLAQTADTRQRPAWTFPERWLPMSAITLGRRTLAPIPWQTVGILAVLVLLLLAAVVAFVGSNRPSVPPPFGVARNGAIASEANGEIVLLDPESGSSSTILGDVAPDTGALFSRDGTRLAYIREGAPGDFGLWVADVEGRNQRELDTGELRDVEAIDWSPDGRSVTVNGTFGGGSSVWIVPTDGSAPRMLDVGMSAEGGLWRPADGSELLFRGRTALGYGLFAVRPDGTGLRPLTASDGNAEWDAFFYGWSPDGTQVAYQWRDPAVLQRMFAVPADGGSPRAVTSGEAGAVHWSPDGSMIAHFTYVGDAARVSVVRADGSAQAVHGPAADSGWELIWSPDGTRIVIQSDAAETAMLLDPVTGATEQTRWSVNNPAWQRLAP